MLPDIVNRVFAPSTTAIYQLHMLVAKFVFFDQNYSSFRAISEHFFISMTLKFMIIIEFKGTTAFQRGVENISTIIGSSDIAA